MKLDNLLILISIISIFLVACTSIDKINTVDSCILFKDKNNWYKSTKKSYDKWGVPISLQLAIINQESSFNQFAKPKRTKIFGLIPGSRPSTAFGYAQVTNPTWSWYKSRTGNTNASRANFRDITDFIGWYTFQSKKMLGIDMNDFYNQYLAYHEGQGGWKKQSYNSKKWLINAAKKVESNANIYNNQLKDCEKKLNKKGLFGLF
tara:strand:- start:888 stop:1502 length:615 start_codon:yes stop_codon:yes gene_type:complete